MYPLSTARYSACIWLRSRRSIRSKSLDCCHVEAQATYSGTRPWIFSLRRSLAFRYLASARQREISRNVSLGRSESLLSADCRGGKPKSSQGLRNRCETNRLPSMNVHQKEQQGLLDHLRAVEERF